MTLTKDDDTPLERAYLREEARHRAAHNDDTPEERAAVQEEARRRKARAALLPVHQLTPVLTDDEYKKWNRCFLTADMGCKEIEPSVVYKDKDQIKFLLLPKAISEAAWLKALRAAQKSRLNSSSRAANGQRYGKKLTIGWIKLGYPGYDNIITAPTLEQPKLAAALVPLLLEMDAAMDEKIPMYQDYAWRCAMNAIKPEEERDDLSRVTDPNDLRMLGVCLYDPWNWHYMIHGTPFSTIELNHNIVFKAHEDGHNAEGTCVCITAFGSFAGGRLVFPRYGYSAELKNGDLLICDNNRELHGNLGPLVGDRYSVVAFLHDSLLGRAPFVE